MSDSIIVHAGNNEPVAFTQDELGWLPWINPLPEAELKAVLQSYPALKEFFWVQEEPRNAGAWRYLLEPLMGMIAELPRAPKFKYVGRPESASPATGFSSSHKYEQKLLVDEALSS